MRTNYLQHVCAHSKPAGTRRTAKSSEEDPQTANSYHMMDREFSECGDLKGL